MDEEYLMLVWNLVMAQCTSFFPSLSLQCRAVRNSEPNFIWSLRRSDVAPRYLKKDQIVNHFSGAWFTTKVIIISHHFVLL